jgi:hypothetical protein
MSCLNQSFISAAGIPRPAFSGTGMRAAQRPLPEGIPRPLGRGSSFFALSENLEYNLLNSIRT